MEFRGVSKSIFRLQRITCKVLHPMKVDPVNFTVFAKIEVNTEIWSLYGTSKSVDEILPAGGKLSSSRYIIADPIRRRFRSWYTCGL